MLYSAQPAKINFVRYIDVKTSHAIATSHLKNAGVAITTSKASDGFGEVKLSRLRGLFVCKVEPSCCK